MKYLRFLRWVVAAGALAAAFSLFMDVYTGAYRWWSFALRLCILGYFVYVLTKTGFKKHRAKATFKKAVFYIIACVLLELLALALWLSGKISKWAFFTLVISFSIALVIAIILTKPRHHNENTDV